MDDELESLDAIARILAGLDPEVVDRVIRWAADRYGSGIYLSDEDLENLDAASQVREELRKSDAPAPATGGTTGAGDAAKEPEAPRKKDPGKPSFLDTQYRMSVAKNLIKKREADEDGNDA